MFIAQFGTGQVFWSMLWFFLFVVWIWLIVSIFTDIFRSPDLSGWQKAAWTIVLIILPYFGAFIYLIARGGSMNERAMEEARRRDEYVRGYVREVAGTTTSPADQLTTLQNLKEQHVIDDQEFERLKAKLMTA
jgi:hypothetical protein